MIWFFVFKQRTADVMRISDWSSDVCSSDLELGLAPGMAAAHARALVTDLDVLDAAPAADAAWLGRLALHAARHWTPTAAVSGADGLWLDLTGTTHLFGGEARFAARLVSFLRRIGFTARVAIAGTPGAAPALARFGDRKSVGWGKSGAVRVDPGGRRNIKKKKKD